MVAAGALINQNDFSHGELEERMYSKSNLELYRKSAKQLRNVVVLPTGGAQRRFGTKYHLDLGNLGDAFMLAEFIYDEDTSYLLVFKNLNLTIYDQTATQVYTTATVWTTAQLTNRELKFTQTHNNLVITHEDVQPYTLVRGALPTNWTLSTLVFKNYPGYDFKQNYDSISFSLDAVAVGQGRTLTASSPLFDTSYVGGWFESYGKELSDNLGVAKITAYVSTTQVTVEVTAEFDSNLTNPVSGSQVLLTEPAFSSTRGWPRSCTFYEGRLYFGGSKSLPDTVFGSVVDDFRNFDIGTAEADDAIQMTLGGHKTGIIKYILGDRGLQIFTSRAEYSAPQLEGRALTPSTFSIRKQSGYGVESVRPIVLDNQTFYVKRGGKGVMSFLFDEGQQSYSSTEISLLSPHLINQPVDAAVLSGTEFDNADYLFIVNDDGTLAIYQSKLAENVSAFTLSETVNTTAGKFKRCVEVDNQIFFAIERTVNSVTSIYLEELDFDVFTDSTYTNTYGVPTDTITGLGHLEGEEVQIKGDGYVLLPKTVSSGQITLEQEVSEVAVGLQYIPLIEPMPLAFNIQNGNNMYEKKKITNLWIDYYESVGIYVDDILIPYRSFGGAVLDQAPTVVTGIYEMKGLLKTWDPRTTIVITQEDPLPMTIIGVGFECTVD